jgi:hypothetical protein
MILSVWNFLSASKINIENKSSGSITVNARSCCLSRQTGKWEPTVQIDHRYELIEKNQIGSLPFYLKNWFDCDSISVNWKDSQRKCWQIKYRIKSGEPDGMIIVYDNGQYASKKEGLAIKKQAISCEQPLDISCMPDGPLEGEML